MDLLEVDARASEKIQQIYQRDKVSLQEDVTMLKNWMETQPHLPEILDDKRIENILLFNKCSIERAKRSIDMYYTLRSQIPDMFANINPKCGNMRKQLEIAYWVPLPKPTLDMYRVQFFKMRRAEMIDDMQPHDVLGWGLNVQELRLKEDVMVGDIFIFDMEGLTFGYMTKLTPTIVAKIMAIYEKIYSLPLKGVYFINSPSYMTALVSILRKILKPKLSERVHVCEDTSILTRFPKKILPKDYGGEEKSLEELQEILKAKCVQ